MTDERYEEGLNVRRQVLGSEHVERSLANSSGFDADFQRFITEMAWGSVWTRSGLDRQTRHMLTIAILASLGREHELALHLRATVNTGLTPAQVAEIFQHVAVYAGVPAANSAFAIARQVYAELGVDLDEV